MPIKLIPPRKGFSPFYYGRGTYLGVFVDRSTKASKPALARKVIAKWERDIESGHFDNQNEPTFASAALSYMQAGGERQYLNRLLDHFKEGSVSTPLRKIDQEAIDNAAATLYPDASNATRNRQVYTPVSAVLRHAGKGFEMKRPKDAQGQRLMGWLPKEKAFPLLQAALDLDAEFGIYLIVLLYTGCRLSEPLRVTCDDVNLQTREMFVGRTKNGQPRRCLLPMAAVTALANHPRGLKRPGKRVFRFTKSGRLYGLLKEAAKKAEITLPPGQKFHILRHSFASWLRRYAKADIDTLLATGAWKSRQSAERYMHMDLNEEAAHADLLPSPAIKFG